jgi:VRR-NUC domain
MPDLCLIYNGRAFFLELKTPNGRLSDNQRACHARLREAGSVVMVADGVNAAVSALQTIGILP